MSTRYEVIAAIHDKTNPQKPPVYARVWVKDRGEWKTKRIAEKHMREYRATHLTETWVQEV